MVSDMNRREFIKESLLASAAGALTLGAGKALAQGAAGGASAPEITPAAFPTGKIGDMQVSRMILGGNLLSFHGHSRDLNYVSTLMEHYNTKEKILETLALSEQQGINTVSVSNPPRVMDILKEHRRRGGKMQWIICLGVPIEEDMKTYREESLKLVEAGADSVYLHGAVCDKLAMMNRPDLLAKAVEIVKDHGVPSGLGGHAIEVVEVAEKNNIPNDYYIKTLHHHKYPTAPRADELKGPHAEVPGYWCKDPNALIELMKTVKKPWIAFKIMAAGAIHPRDAFRWAFENGGDHILVGMFDFQLVEDVAIGREALKDVKRARPWCS